MDSKRTILCWGLLVWLAVAATLRGWAAPRRCATALAATFLIVAAVVNRLARRSWIPQSERRRLAWLGISALLAAGVGIFAGGAYMGDRFSASSEDLEARMRHWSNGTAMLRGTSEWWLGKGFGTFPVSYFSASPTAYFPGAFHCTRPKAVDICHSRGRDTPRAGAIYSAFRNAFRRFPASIPRCWIYVQ